MWNQSMETEERKLKYGSEKKGCLLVFSALLTHDCVSLCVLRLCSQWLTVSQRSESRILGSQAAASVTIMMLNDLCLVLAGVRSPST